MSTDPITQLFRDVAKQFEPKPDPRDPDYSRQGIFIDHNCSRCSDGARPCVQRNPMRCEYPHARND